MEGTHGVSLMMIIFVSFMIMIMLDTVRLTMIMFVRVVFIITRNTMYRMCNTWLLGRPESHRKVEVSLMLIQEVVTGGGIIWI
jgi:hypothetical protein